MAYNDVKYPRRQQHHQRSGRLVLHSHTAMVRKSQTHTTTPLHRARIKHMVSIIPPYFQGVHLVRILSAAGQGQALPKPHHEILLVFFRLCEYAYGRYMRAYNTFSTIHWGARRPESLKVSIKTSSTYA